MSAQALLKRERPLPLDAAMPIIRQVGSALEALHAKGIVHRDLKPSNITLTPKKPETTRAVVLDFGLAKPADEDAQLFGTQVEFHAGAPFFMAPELWAAQALRLTFMLSVSSSTR